MKDLCAPYAERLPANGSLSIKSIKARAMDIICDEDDSMAFDGAISSILRFADHVLILYEKPTPAAGPRGGDFWRAPHSRSQTSPRQRAGLNPSSSTPSTLFSPTPIQTLGLGGEGLRGWVKPCCQNLIADNASSMPWKRDLIGMY